MNLWQNTDWKGAAAIGLGAAGMDYFLDRSSKKAIYLGITVAVLYVMWTNYVNQGQPAAGSSASSTNAILAAGGVPPIS